MDTRNETQRNHLRYSPPKRSDKTPEAKVSAAVDRYLKSIGALNLRTSAGVAQFGERKVMMGAAGTSDRTCCIGGRFVAIEIKSATGKPTPSQEQYLARVRAAGGVAIVARSAEDVKAALTEAGLL